MKSWSCKTIFGFTLLELVVVIAALGILYSIALPSYQSLMLRVHRTEAVVALLDVANCQEKIFAHTGRYDTTRCIPERMEHYSIRIDPLQVTDSLLFTAWAEPLGHQANDGCGVLGLDQTGRRRISVEQGDANKCWHIR